MKFDSILKKRTARKTIGDPAANASQSSSDPSSTESHEEHDQEVLFIPKAKARFAKPEPACHTLEGSNTAEPSEVVKETSMPAACHRPKADEVTFPTQALGNLSSIVTVVAESLQVEPSMVTGVLLAVLSSILQPHFNVSVRCNDEGMPLSVNVFIVADSGERKSSTINAIAKPLYSALQRVQDARKHMLIQDVTVDGLVVGLINRCPAQLLLVPEAATLLSSHAMSKENLLRFLGVVSSLFSGEAVSRTRVEEHHYAEERRLNALIMSQHVVAMEFLGSDMVMQQGLGNRFLYAAPQARSKARQFIDDDLTSNPIYVAYCDRIQQMVSRPLKINQATGGVDVKVVRASPAAKAVWIKHYNALETGSIEGGPYASQTGYASRFAEQTLRLAGILTLTEDIDADQITEQAMRSAVMLGDYYLQSAFRLFTKAPADKDELNAQALLKWMQGKQKTSGLTTIPLRMIYREAPRMARSVAIARKLVNILEERGDISKDEGSVKYGGKMSTENYSVNSAI